MLVLLIQRCQCTSSISLPSLKNPNLENLWLRPRSVARKSLLAACLFEESDSGGKRESPQLHPDRAQNKRTDPVPDGIERAEPTIAPSRHRLTSELANSRFHCIQTDLEAGSTVATTIGIPLTTSLERCQVV